MGVPDVLAINEVAGKTPEHHPRRGGELEVDPGKLRRELLKVLPSRAVVHGHMLPDVLRPSEVQFVALLRCEPLVLRDRLRKRNYDAEKVTQNVEAELIGVLLDECVTTFGAGRVREYDTTEASPREVARAIARDVEALAASTGKRRAPPSRWIDWTLAYDSSSKLRSLLSGARDAPGST